MHFIDRQCQRCLMKQLPFYGQEDLSFNPILNVNDCILVEGMSHASPQFFYFPSQKGLKLSHLNIRSLKKIKKEGMEIILQRYPYDILSLSETWLDNFSSLQSLSIPFFVFERKDSKMAEWHVTFNREGSTYKRRFDLKSEHIDCMWIEIILPNHSFNFLLRFTET